MPITPAVDLDGLLLLLPHELMGIAKIVGMQAVDDRRNHLVSTDTKTSDMLAAGNAGAMQSYYFVTVEKLSTQHGGRESLLGHHQQFKRQQRSLQMSHLQQVT